MRNRAFPAAFALLFTLLGSVDGHAFRGGFPESATGYGSTFLGTGGIANLGNGRCQGVFIHSDMVLTAAACVRQLTGADAPAPAAGIQPLSRRFPVAAGRRFDTEIYPAPAISTPDRQRFKLIRLSGTGPLTDGTQVIFKTAAGTYVNLEHGHLASATLVRDLATRFELRRTDGASLPIAATEMFKLKTDSTHALQEAGTDDGMILTESTISHGSPGTDFYFSRLQELGGGEFDVDVAVARISPMPAWDNHLTMPGIGFLAYRVATEATHAWTLAGSKDLVILILAERKFEFTVGPYESSSPNSITDRPKLVLETPWQQITDGHLDGSLQIASWAGPLRPEKHYSQLVSNQLRCGIGATPANVVSCAIFSNDIQMVPGDVGMPVLWWGRNHNGQADPYPSVLGITIATDNPSHSMKIIPLFDARLHTGNPAPEPTLWSSIREATRKSGCVRMLQATPEPAHFRPLYHYVGRVELPSIPGQPPQPGQQISYIGLSASDAACDPGVDTRFDVSSGVLTYQGVLGYIGRAHGDLGNGSTVLFRFGTARTAGTGDVLTTDGTFTSHAEGQGFANGEILGWVYSPTLPRPSSTLPLSTWFNPLINAYRSTTEADWQGTPGQVKLGYHFVRLEGFVKQ